MTFVCFLKRKRKINELGGLISWEGMGRVWEKETCGQYILDKLLKRKTYVAFKLKNPI